MKVRREMFPHISPISQKEPEKKFPLCPETVYLSSGAMQILKSVASKVKLTQSQGSVLPTGTAASKHPFFNGLVIT